jgi:hypothetical protein
VEKELVQVTLIRFNELVLVENRNKRLVHENKLLTAKVEELLKEIRVMKKQSYNKNYIIQQYVDSIKVDLPKNNNKLKNKKL